MPPEQQSRPSSSKTSAPADSDESPKHARRERKPATERYVPELEPPLIPDDTDRGRKRRLQDPLPLEDNARSGSGRSTDRKGPTDNSTASVNPTRLPRSSHYFQHDDRAAVTSGRNIRRRTADDRWTDHSTKSHSSDKARETIAAQARKNTSSQAPAAKADDAWTHDKFLEMQAEGLDRKSRHSPPQRARPGKREFREHPFVRSDNKGEQKNDYPEWKRERRHSDINIFQRERGRYGQRVDESEGGRWMDSDRYQPRYGHSRYLGDDHHHGGHIDMVRSDIGSTTATVNERWTHDMFEELNRSPTPQQEEDSIAQIEALLAA